MNNCQNKWPWIWKLQAGWSPSTWHKNFSPPISLLLSTAAAWWMPRCISKDFLEAWGAIKKKKTESELSFRVQKPYEDQFGFETWGRFSMKTQNCLMYAHLDGDCEMKGKRGWAHWSLTAYVSLSEEPQGRRHNQWMSMREGRINKMLSSVARCLLLFFMWIQRSFK